MSQVGTFVQANEVPPASISLYDVATVFVVGEADSGPVGTPTLVTSLANAASTFGTPSGTGNPYSSRTTTCATLFDALELFFGEGGYRAYVSRVVGPSPTSATLAVLDGSAGTSLTFTAQTVGVGGNGIYIAIQNNTSTYMITLQDASGNVIAVSPLLTTKAAGVTWAATTGLVTAVAGAGTLPATLAATAMSGGGDGRGSATLTNWQNALAVFLPTLGPGQVIAPGQTNTNLSGIWSALGIHASQNNRVAICDMDDGQTAATLVTDLGSFGTASTGSYCGFWAGNLIMPGVVPNTTRTISPSPAIAGLCARVDSLGTGNVNQMAAGVNYPLQYASANATIMTGTGGAAYSNTDLYTLNDAGINTFAIRDDDFVNYGFVSSVSKNSDAIYWQLNHGRLRMSLIADAQVLGEPFVFSQIDGQGADALSFQDAIQANLTTYYTKGALFGATASDAFSIDVGSDVNTPATEQAGNLNLVANVRMSPGAQKVTITLNAVPITSTV